MATLAEPFDCIWLMGFDRKSAKLGERLGAPAEKKHDSLNKSS